MPTPKEVRFHFGRLKRRFRLLSEALDAAHRAEVLMYDSYPEQSPCKTNFETWERIKATTEKQLAAAMRGEIYKEMGEY